MSIENLLKEAWNNLKQNFSRLVILNLVVFGATFLLAILLIIALGIGALGNLSNLSNPSGWTHLIGPFALLIAIFVVIFIVVSLIVQAATILILGDDTHYTLGQLLKLGLKLAPAVFAVGLVSAILTIPALFLLIIPGIIAGLLLSFSTYELILGKRGVFESLKRSAYLVKKNFGYVFVRILVVIGLTLVIWVITAAFGRAQGGGLISWVIGMVFGWYIQSYMILMYKDLESKSKDKKAGVSLIGFAIVAVLGYLVVGVIVSSIIKLAKNPSFQEELKKGYSQSLQQETKSLNNLKVQ